MGKLPHATKEAEWVSHILKCKPILHEQATKDAVMMRIMNAKVIHLATHGTAIAGFLALAGMSASYGMARASILARAQSAITTACNNYYDYNRADQMEHETGTVVLYKQIGIQIHNGSFSHSIQKLKSPAKCTQVWIKDLQKPDNYFNVHMWICTLIYSWSSLHFLHFMRAIADKSSAFSDAIKVVDLQLLDSGRNSQCFLGITTANDEVHQNLGISEKQEKLPASSALIFANTINPLQVIRYHPTIYSKCYHKHNIAIVGNTCKRHELKRIALTQESVNFPSISLPHTDETGSPQSEKEDFMHNYTLQESCASNSSLKNQLLKKETTPSHSSALVCGTKSKSMPACLEYIKDIHNSSTEVNMYICLYYDQEEFHVAHPKFNNPVSSNVCMETCVSDALSIVHTNVFQKVVVVIDAKANCLDPTVIPILQEKWMGSFHFRFILFPPGIAGPDLPAIVHSPVNALVVGNPTISPNNNSQIKVFPPLHCGTKEAEFVSYILKCFPILHENATKEAVINKMQNASFVHIATHLSGSEGYLAFACTSSFTTTNLMEFCMTPQEVEKLELPLVLVVLSSCNSAKMKYGGGEIEGLTKAFLRAGAQAVISTNSKVWDNSALVFMKFFYHYFIVDQIKGGEALHKAMISMRCIPQYSDPSHWSPYAYYGREVEFRSNLSPSSTQLTSCLGPCSVFPRMEILKALKSVLLNSSTTLPTDVQVLSDVCVLWVEPSMGRSQDYYMYISDMPSPHH